jgi:hypothetical protein
MAPVGPARGREAFAQSADRAPGRGVSGRLAQAAQFIKARSNQMRPLGEIIDETLSGS